MILSKEVWDRTAVPQRVINCKLVGLEGRVGSKEWNNLTEVEMYAVMGLELPVYREGNVVVTNEERVAELVIAGQSTVDSILARYLKL